MTQPVQPVVAEAPAVRGDNRSRWGVPLCGYYSNAAIFWMGMRLLPLAYLLVWMAAGYFFLFLPRARRSSMRYLDLVAGGRKRGAFIRMWQTYRHMVTFGILLLDRTLMLARPRHGFTIQAEGLENLAEANKESAGILMLSAHLGNAEIGAPYIRRMGISRRVHIVMYLDPRHGTERFFSRNRPMLQEIDIISTTDPLSAGTKIMAALKHGDVVAMRADRTISGKGVAVTFLGERVNFPAGPFMAAVLTGVPVVHIYTCRLGYRRYTCRMSPVHRYEQSERVPREELIARAAQDYATHLESVLREFPYQWSNFYDFWQLQKA